MKKISTCKANNILLKYILKVVLFTFISILLFTYISSVIIYHFDLDMKSEMIFSIFICAISGAITGFISTLGVKNNGAILGTFAQVPLLFCSLLNVIFNDNTLLFFLIKAVIIICVGMLSGILAVRTTNKQRFK